MDKITDYKTIGEKYGNKEVNNQINKSYSPFS